MVTIEYKIFTAIPLEYIFSPFLTISNGKNKSIKEIADTLNISVKGVDYHIGKALKALRVNLKDYLYLFFI